MVNYLIFHHEAPTMTTGHLHAAQYIRMSTDRQDLSPMLQKEAIAAFAQTHGFTVVRTFEDEGKSGIRIANRPGLRSLLREVESNPEFKAVLVYDVSRWGRFQDVDAGAYYDYHCKLNNVEVIYIAEGFGREPLPMNMLAKSIKRVMAAEYSRELAAKSRAGQLRVVSMGFHMGPLPPLGYRRESVSSNGERRVLLERGELKRALTDRIVWVLGPPQEVELVRRICSYYASSRLDIPDIAALVSGSGWRTAKGCAITTACVRRLITNEALIGNFVWGIGTTLRRIFQSIPTRQDNSVPRIIDDLTWSAIQARVARRSETVFYRRRSTTPAQESNPATEQIADDVLLKRYRTSGEHCKHTREFGRALCADLNSSNISAGYEPMNNVLCLWGILVRIRLVWLTPDSQWCIPRVLKARPVDYVLIARMRAPFQPLDFILITRLVYERSQSQHPDILR